MANDAFSLSSNAETLLGLEVEEALTQSEKAEIWSYGQAFFGKGKEVQAGGHDIVARAWQLLGQLSQVGLQESNPDEPFQPMFQGPQGRSILPSDLDDVTAQAVRQLGMATKDAELRSRLLDVTWDKLRDPDAARNAVESYVEAANRLYDPDHWIGYVTRIERALRLARQLRDQRLLDLVLGDIERHVIELDGIDPLFMTARLMELLHEFKRGDPDTMSQIALKAAGSAEEKKDFDRARSHYENLVRWRRMAKDANGEREANLAIAESYFSQADLHSAPGGEMNVAHLLEQAHEAYRNISGMREKAAEVYESLREAQLRARDSLQQIRSESIDLSPVIKDARERVSGKPFREALLGLATVTPPTNFEHETKNVREMMKKFPLQGILGGNKIDDDGRIVAHRTVALTSDENQAKQALWERVVEQVLMGYQMIVQAQIAPAINQLMFEHSPTLRDLRALVVNNPFIPPGHEELFAKGFLAGLRWNFAEALSILVPQVENSLRHLLAGAGAEVTTRDKLGLQTVIPMGTILSDRQAMLETILGADLIKELKILFTDQHGADLRNQVAHGLMAHRDFYGSAAIYAWWFILFLCINPVYRRFRNAGSGAKEPTASAPVDGSASSQD